MLLMVSIDLVKLYFHSYVASMQVLNIKPC